jgi:hypothetical protein
MCGFTYKTVAHCAYLDNKVGDVGVNELQSTAKHAMSRSASLMRILSTLPRSYCESHHHGYRRDTDTNGGPERMSAFGRKADIGFGNLNVS